jgi:hypothetical protein
MMSLALSIPTFEADPIATGIAVAALVTIALVSLVGRRER